MVHKRFAQGNRINCGFSRTSRKPPCASDARCLMQRPAASGFQCGAGNPQRDRGVQAGQIAASLLRRVRRNPLFDPAVSLDVFAFRGERLGITICEDAWNDPDLWPETPYTVDPVSVLAQKGATLFINLSGSPFHLGKENYVFHNAAPREKHAIPFIYLNQIGGNDELIFDGNSMVINKNGALCVALPEFVESIRPSIPTDWTTLPWKKNSTPSTTSIKPYALASMITCISAILKGPSWASRAVSIPRSPALLPFPRWVLKTSRA